MLRAQWDHLVLPSMLRAQWDHLVLPGFHTFYTHEGRVGLGTILCSPRLAHFMAQSFISLFYRTTLILAITILSTT